MQHTALPGADTTCGTGNGRQLFGREFALLHSGRMRQHAVANLYNFAHRRIVGNKSSVQIQKGLSWRGGCR